MKSELKVESKFLRYLILISSAITVISSILILFFKISLPGLCPIALSICLLCLGIQEFNIFKYNKEKLRLTLSLFLFIVFLMNFIIGIEQIKIYFLL